MPTRLPDPARSQAVLIGAGIVPAKLGLSRLPELRGQLTRLGSRLAGTVEQPATLANPRSVAKVHGAVRQAAAEATDLLLVYCAGYVRSDQEGRPRLILASTVPDELAATAVSLDKLTGYIVASRAAIKVLLLDCDGWTVALPGTAILAGGRSRMPHRPSTAFTEALLAALDNPNPLSFAGLHRRVNKELVRRDQPKAQAKAADVALVRGLAGALRISDAVPDQPVSGQIQLGMDPVKVGRSQRRFIRRIAAVDGLVGFGAVAAALWLPGAGPLLAAVLGLILLVGVARFGRAVNARKRPGVTTVLQIDGSGITLRRLAADPVDISWSDVVTAGLAPPGACVDGYVVHEGDHVFVVKLRPDMSRPVLVPLLIPELEQLGYLGLAKLGDLNITTHKLLAELDRFAGDKAARSNRDWYTRHPELWDLLDVNWYRPG
jgi:hypothetical protein